MVFLDPRVLLSYVDDSGEWKKWRPTQDEIYDREQILASDWYLTHLRNGLLNGAWLGLSGFGAAFLGWRAAKLQRGNTERPRDG